MADAFQVEGRVTEVLLNGMFRAKLPNGHRLMAFVLARDKKRFAGLKSGDVIGYTISDPRIMGYLRNNSIFTFGKADRAKTSATMREILPFAAVDCAAMIDLPPFDAKAPRTKSS